MAGKRMFDMKKSSPGMLRLWQVDIFLKNMNFLFQIPISNQARALYWLFIQAVTRDVL